VQTIIADLLSPRERPLVQSYVSVTFMSASILGPVLGGLLTDHLHWSMIFWLNLPLGTVALVMTARALRTLPRHERPHRLDIVGGALMVGAALALMLALTWGGVRYGWASWGIVGLLVGSAVLWILFVARLLTAREPFIPLSVLRDGAVRVGTAASFLAVGAVIALTIDEEGMAKTADRKIEIAQRIFKLATERHGIRPSDIRAGSLGSQPARQPYQTRRAHDPECCLYATGGRHPYSRGARLAGRLRRFGNPAQRKTDARGQQERRR
jgi:hypothetical protein